MKNFFFLIANNIHVKNNNNNLLNITLYVFFRGCSGLQALLIPSSAMTFGSAVPAQIASSQTTDPPNAVCRTSGALV